MKKLAAILLLLCCLCFGEESPKCRELFEKFPDFAREDLEMPSVSIETETKEECPCVETIACGNNEYCIAYQCLNEEPMSVFEVIFYDL